MEALESVATIIRVRKPELDRDMLFQRHLSISTAALMNDLIGQLRPERSFPEAISEEWNRRLVPEPAAAFVDLVGVLLPELPEHQSVLRRLRDRAWQLDQLETEKESHYVGNYLLRGCHEATESYEKRQMLERRLGASLSDSIEAIQAAATTVTDLVERHNKIAETPAEDQPSEITDATAPKVAGRKIVTIERWSDLAIGIHAPPMRGIEYYAFRPPPSPGDIVSIGRGTLLHLPGKRWPEVLDCFAGSTDGRTASKKELYARLHLKRQPPKRERGQNDEDERESAFARKQAEQAMSDRLRKGMSDLSAKLRKLIECAEAKKVPPFQGKESPTYQSAFTVGLIIKGDDGQLRFRPKT